MSASIAEAVRQLVHNKGISEDLILQTVEDILIVAYKKKFGTNENVVTKINEEKGEVSLFARKIVVDEVDDDILEISLEEAKKGNSDCEIDDEVLVEIMPSDLGRIAAQTARQIVFQRLKEIEKNIIYSEYVQKKGQIITGFYQREKNGHIFVDIGRTEAILLRAEQSPKEVFAVGERIKAIVLDVQNSRKGAQVILSRTSPLFVQRLFEFEVPEIVDGVIQVKSIVRDPGYRTKIAVSSLDIDPVGACVGMKGMRIQMIVKELEGERIDIIRHNDNIRDYIANALSPAKIEQVVVLNEANKEALAVVGDNHLSLAIGKLGQNVRLAAKLTGWNIDIKTESEFKDLDYQDESKRIAEDLFVDNESEYHDLSELEELDKETITLLKEKGISYLEELVEVSKEELSMIDGIDEEKANAILNIIKENIVVLGDEEETNKDALKETQEDTVEDSKEDDDYNYYCPECNTELELGMNKCPGCEIEIEF